MRFASWRFLSSVYSPFSLTLKLLKWITYTYLNKAKFAMQTQTAPTIFSLRWMCQSMWNQTNHHIFISPFRIELYRSSLIYPGATDFFRISFAYPHGYYIVSFSNPMTFQNIAYSLQITSFLRAFSTFRQPRVVNSCGWYFFSHTKKLTLLSDFFASFFCVQSPLVYWCPYVMNKENGFVGNWIWWYSMCRYSIGIS